MKPLGTGTVLPPATATASLPEGKVTVTMKSVMGENDRIPGALSEHQLVACEYPGGFVKEHQVKTPEDLAAKVVNLLRSRYGAGEVKILKLPALKAGAVIEMEV